MDSNTQKLKLSEYSNFGKELKLGTIYEHYSGKRYKIISIARHTETLEELVVYQALYGDLNFWVRPLKMFCGEIEINSCIIPRFRCLVNI